MLIADWELANSDCWSVISNSNPQSAIANQQWAQGVTVTVTLSYENIEPSLATARST